MSEKLRRYSPNEGINGDGSFYAEMVEDQEGDWVKYEDVKSELREKVEKPKVSFTGVMQKWNDLALAHGFPKISLLTDKRKLGYSLRIRTFPDFWKTVEAELPLLKKFCREGWFGFDWLIESDTNFAKFSEGLYREPHLAMKAYSSGKVADDKIEAVNLHKRRVEDQFREVIKGHDSQNRFIDRYLEKVRVDDGLEFSLYLEEKYRKEIDYAKANG